MKITNANIVNFRNILKADISLSGGLSIFCGENGQGKTNTVEAILLALTGRSHRENVVKNFINENSQAARVKVRALTDDGTSHEVGLMLSEGKTHLIDNSSVKKRAELLEYFPVIFFGPDDLRIVKDSPAERRKFLNDAISVAAPVYDSILSEYTKVLRQRNSLLKSYSPSDIYMLEVYDEALVKYASSIIASRIKYLREFSDIFTALYADISEGREEVSLGYVSDVLTEDVKSSEDIKTAYAKMLADARGADIAAASTTKGVHHDDVSVYMNGRSARKFSSQGQQRTTALCMKLASAQMLYQKRSKRALILLDDVMSELDDRRKESILSTLGEYQIAVTCVKPDFDYNKHTTALFNVEKGCISQ